MKKKDVLNYHKDEKPLKERFKEFFDKKTRRSIIYVIIGSIIYSFSIVYFLNFGGFFTGCITGISQLISYLIFGYVTPYLGIIVGLLNIPLFLIGWRGVSIKFAVSTIFAVITQTLFISIFQIMMDSGINPFLSLGLTNEAGEFVDNGMRLLFAIIGGGLSGYGGALCLKAGGSAGGMDVIANYLFVKKNISFTKYSFIVDGLIILISAVFINVETALFTIIRLFVSLFAIEYTYTIYKVVKIEIITDNAEAMRKALLNKFHHGLTMYKIIGGYTLQEKTMIEVFVSAYEVNDYESTIEKIDKKAFVTVTALKQIKGNYIRKTII